MPLLARALAQAGIDAPVTTGLARLIAGELPLDDWVELVRTTVPLPARRRVGVRVQPGFWKRLWARVRDVLQRRSASVVIDGLVDARRRTRASATRTLSYCAIASRIDGSLLDRVGDQPERADVRRAARGPRASRRPRTRPRARSPRARRWNATPLAFEADSGTRW